MDLCNDGIVFALVFPKRSYWWSEITTCTCRHLWTCNSLIATAWNFTLFCKYTVRRLQPLPMTSLASLASVVMSCTVPHASWWQKFNKFLIILTRMTPSGILTHTTHNLSSSAHPRPAGARISSSWRPSACSTAPLLPAWRRWLCALQALTSWAMAVLVATWDEWSPWSSHHHKRGSF
jgi:hypothetical protein